MSCLLLLVVRRGEMQQPKRGEVRGCCVLWCTDPSSHYNVPHSERKPQDCGDTRAEWVHHLRLCRGESLKAVTEAVGAVSGWYGGQRAQRGHKDRGRGRWSIHWLLPRPSGPQRMSLSFQTRGKTHKNCLYCGGKKPKCLKSMHIKKIGAICAAATKWIFPLYVGCHCGLLPHQRTIITYRLL